MSLAALGRYDVHPRATVFILQVPLAALLLLFGSWISDAAPAIAVWESPRSWIADGNHADWSGPAMATRGATTGAQWVGSSSRGTLRLGQSLLCHVPGRLCSRQPAPQSPVCCCCCCFFFNIAITCTIIIIIITI